MLVYTDGQGGGPALLDADGDPLADIGPMWAVPQLEDCLGYGGGYCLYLGEFATGHLPLLDSLAPIPCP